MIVVKLEVTKLEALFDEVRKFLSPDSVQRVFLVI